MISTSVSGARLRNVRLSASPSCRASDCPESMASLQASLILPGSALYSSLSPKFL